MHSNRNAQGGMCLGRDESCFPKALLAELAANSDTTKEVLCVVSGCDFCNFCISARCVVLLAHC